jgi:hypothetical protein
MLLFTIGVPVPLLEVVLELMPVEEAMPEPPLPPSPLPPPLVEVSSVPQAPIETAAPKPVIKVKSRRFARIALPPDQNNHRRQKPRP